jgi:hypothetical protein
MTVFAAAFAFFVSPPSPEMERLAWLIGEWSSVERSTAPGRDPVDFTLDGKNEWSLGGAAIRIEETLHLPGGTKSYNLIIIRWDAQAKNYRMSLYVSAAPNAREFTGSIESNNLIFVHTPEPGKGSPLRITYAPKNATECDALLEVKVGDNWEVRTVAKYTKKAPPG